MRHVLLLMFPFLAACATPAPQMARILPPAELLQPCEEPQHALSTTGDLVPYALDLREALRACNQDKRLLREWAGEADGTPQP